MKKSTAALFLIIGLTVGIGVTSLVFVWFNHVNDEGLTKVQQSQIKPSEDKESFSDRDAAVTPFVSQIEEAIILAGNCKFKGVVKNPQGQLIEGASVHLKVRNDPWTAPLSRLETITDDSGRFEFNSLNEKLSYQLWVWSANYAIAVQDDVQCDADFELILEQAASLSVTLREQEECGPGPVELQIAGSSLWPARTWQMNSGETSTIEGLDAGEYFLRASAGDCAYVSREPIVIEEGIQTRVGIELIKTATTRISVIENTSGTRVARAIVLVGTSFAPLIEIAATTNSRGEAIFDALPRGLYTVRVMAPGYVTSDPKTFPSGTKVEMALERGARVSGTVMLASGVPIQGATLGVDRNTTHALATVPPGGGHEFQARFLRSAAQGWPTLHRVDGNKYISGPQKMSLPEKKPFEQPENSTNIMNWRPTDDEGRFLLDGLPSGSFLIWAKHPDYTMNNKIPLSVESGGFLEDIRVIMQRGISATIRILSDDAFPIENAEVSIYDTSGQNLSTQTSGADGYVDFRGMPKSFRVEASAENYVSAFTIYRGKKDDNANLEITLPEADRVIHGRVVDPQGYGIDGAAIIARTSSKRLLHVLTGVTERDGTFALEGAGPGLYHITADSENAGRVQIAGASYKEKIKLVVGKTSGSINNNNFISPGSLGKSPWMDNPIDFAEADNLNIIEKPNLSEPNDGPDLQAPDLQVPDLQVPDLQTPDFQAPNEVHAYNTYGEIDSLPVTGPPPGKGGLPITLGGGPGNVIVKHVSPGSRVALAGLLKGHRILAIDGEKVKGPNQARQALSGPIGSVVMLEVEHEGERFTVVVQREKSR